MSNLTVLTDRLFTHRRFRMPLAISGAAVLSLSMLLSVGTALGAANNGNGNGADGNSSGGETHGTSGNVKVHDVGTGVETSGTDNEPHVCAFWLGFELDAPYEAGTWVVASWAPTGDGSTVASGLYDTAGDGVDISGVIDMPAGHYRVEWAATGATSSKKKTFWVDADCGTASTPVDETQAEEPVPPTDAPSSPDEESQPEDVTPPTDAPGSPDEESQPEDVTPPTDAPGSPDEESQPDELVLSGEETVPDEDETPGDQAPATDEEGVVPTDEEAAPPVEQPADSTDDEEVAQAEEPGSIDPGTPPAQDELGSVGSTEGPTMSDTATPQAPVQGGEFAGIALLMLIGAHMAMRRDRLVPSTHN